MYKVVKSCDGSVRELKYLIEPLEITKYTIDTMLEILRNEMEVALKKKEMMKE